jgi:hypothetical protein
VDNGEAEIVGTWIDYQGRSVELTGDRWTHILSRHPDMAARLPQIAAAIESPV